MSATQPTLFDVPSNLAELLRLQEAAVERRAAQRALPLDRVEQSFREYHAGHPWVYERLVETVRWYAGRGRKRGVGFFFEVLRHEMFMGDTHDADGFKLNNNFRSRYARLIEDRCPDLRGYFRKRRLRARLP